MRYLRLLSRRQLFWTAGALLLMLALVAAGLLTDRGSPPPKAEDFHTGMTLRETAGDLGVTGKAMAKELGLSIDTPKNVPLAELGVTAETLEEVVHHLAGHSDSSLKYWIYAALMVWGWLFLTRIGRIEGGHKAKDRKAWYPRVVYTAALLVAVVVAGFLLGKSPNPMEGAVKVFKAMVGLYPDVLAKLLSFLFFLGLALFANKLICGWGCPFGALQELCHSLPVLKKLKRRAKPPFLVMNLIRGVLFLVVLLVLFGVVGGKKGLVLYHYVNPFNLFNLDFELASIAVTTVVALALGFVIYRPFCQILCPFGFLSWIAERLSIYRVRIDHDLCDECGACVKACPSSAADGLVKRDLLRADCFSCGKCLSVCHMDAIRYESVFAKRRTREPDPTPQAALKNG